METIIDNIKLDQTNEDFNQAADFVSNTDKPIFLTGKAGTGKTTFLKYIKSITSKNTVILAPTGVAAINAGGVTINSFFQVPFGPFVPNDKRLRTSKVLGEEDDTTIYTTFKYREEKRNIIDGLELLIIDEISMVRCDMLDVIDKILRVFRKNPFLPFGGVQVLLIGDTFQLPPIASEKTNEWQILAQFYASRFFFSSKVMTSLVETKTYVHFELKKIYRQKEQEFIDLLNRVRVNQTIPSDIQLLDSKFNPTFTSNGIDSHIILSTHNFQVDQTNQTKLDALTSELKTFQGELKGEFPKDSKGSYIFPTDMDLKLKEGAQVMFLKNDAGEVKRYFNGKIGKIKSLSETVIVVEFSNGTIVPVEKATWNHIEYTWNKEKKKVEEKVKGTFTQYPLRLAWAITVHKSQGLTFEKVIADLGAAFEDGQVYVALSRCTSSYGLHLKSKIPKTAIRANPHAIEFAKHETPGTLIVQQLNEGKADFFYKKSREAMNSNQFQTAFENFTTATKFRNDIETDVFKRYFVAFSSRLTSFKTISKNLAVSIEEVKKSNELLVTKNYNLQAKTEEQEQKIGEQNRGIKLSINKIEDLETKTEQIESQLNDIKEKLEKKIKAYNFLNENFKALNSVHSELKRKIEEEKIARNKDINESNKLLKIADNIIKECQAQNKSKDLEIERLNNLKWHEKIRGRK